MLRNPIPASFNYKTNDILFQIIDWNANDVYINNDEHNDEHDEGRCI